jgi:hypothetical protein
MSKAKDFGTQWGLLKTAHYYFDQAVQSGNRWHIESAGKSLARALEQYAELAGSYLVQALPVTPPASAHEAMGVVARRLGRIVGGQYVSEEE